jgi:hypothetical protein
MHDGSYSAEVADVLEAAGEAPQGSEAALRELAPVLHQKGAQVAVEACRAVADAGTLPLVKRGSDSDMRGMWTARRAHPSTNSSRALWPWRSRRPRSSRTRSSRPCCSTTAGAHALSPTRSSSSPLTVPHRSTRSATCASSTAHGALPPASVWDAGDPTSGASRAAANSGDELTPWSCSRSSTSPAKRTGRASRRLRSGTARSALVQPRPWGEGRAERPLQVRPHPSLFSASTSDDRRPMGARCRFGVRS